MRLSLRQIQAWRCMRQYKQLVEKLTLLEKLYEEFEVCIEKCEAASQDELIDCIVKCYREVRRRHGHGV